MVSVTYGPFPALGRSPAALPRTYPTFSRYHVNRKIIPLCCALIIQRNPLPGLYKHRVAKTQLASRKRVPQAAGLGSMLGREHKSF